MHFNLVCIITIYKFVLYIYNAYCTLHDSVHDVGRIASTVQWGKQSSDTGDWSEVLCRAMHSNAPCTVHWCGQCLYCTSRVNWGAVVALWVVVVSSDTDVDRRTQADAFRTLGPHTFAYSHTTTLLASSSSFSLIPLCLLSSWSVVGARLNVNQE